MYPCLASLASDLVANHRHAPEVGVSRDLTEREVRYLMDREWARTAEDVLWRRSKLGLRLSQAEAERLGDFMREALAGAAAPMAAVGGAS